MQPFERLRSLARGGDADDELLVEIAGCLAELEDDPAGLVVSCRRLVDHHRDWGALWWLASRVLASARPAWEATRALDEVVRDETPARLAAALPFPAGGPVAVLGWPDIGAHLLAERADLTVVSVTLDPGDDSQLPPVAEIDASELAEIAPSHLLVEPPAAGPTRVPLRSGSTRILDACPATTRIWAITPTGSVLPEPLLDALVAAGGLTEWVSPQRFDRAVGPRGPAPPETLIDRVDAPVAPELLRPLR